MPSSLDWRAAWTDAAAVLLAATVAENAFNSLSCLLDNAKNLSIVLGWSKGFCALSVATFSFLQSAGCIALVASPIYHKVGSVGPSAMLASTVWAEALFMGDLGQPLFLLRSVCIGLSAACLGLFRVDLSTRNAQLQVPVDDWVQFFETRTRRMCTAAKCGAHCPPLGIALLAWAWRNCAFWQEGGVLREYSRACFQSSVAVAALLFCLGAQDSRANARLSEVREEVVALVVPRRFRGMQHRHAKQL